MTLKEMIIRCNKLRGNKKVRDQLLDILLDLDNPLVSLTCEGRKYIRARAYLIQDEDPELAEALQVSF